MKTILNLNHHRFLLPAGCNINALVAILSKVKELEFDYAGKTDNYVIREKAPTVSIEIADDDRIIPRPKLKQITEKAGPDVHNTFGS